MGSQITACEQVEESSEEESLEDAPASVVRKSTQKKLRKKDSDFESASSDAGNVPQIAIKNNKRRLSQFNDRKKIGKSKLGESVQESNLSHDRVSSDADLSDIDETIEAKQSKPDEEFGSGEEKDGKISAKESTLSQGSDSCGSRKASLTENIENEPMEFNSQSKRKLQEIASRNYYDSDDVDELGSDNLSVNESLKLPRSGSIPFSRAESRSSACSLPSFNRSQLAGALQVGIHPIGNKGLNSMKRLGSGRGNSKSKKVDLLRMELGIETQTCTEDGSQFE